MDNVKALEECGIDVPEIYALKSTEKNQNAIDAKDSKWVYFKDWATAAFVSHLNDNNLKQRLYDLSLIHI